MITSKQAIEIEKFSFAQRIRISQLEKRIDDQIIRHLKRPGFATFQIEEDDLDDEIRQHVLDNYRAHGWTVSVQRLEVHVSYEFKINEGYYDKHRVNRS